MPADPKIRDDLSKWKLPAQAADDCVAISNELSAGPDSKAVIAGLTQLDKLLTERIKVSPKQAMGTVLQNSEHGWGVNVDANNGVRVTALRGLSAGEFAGELVNATLIKDPGALPDHGEYTHRIQWFVVHSQGLAKDANALLRLMGDASVLPDKDKLNGLWDCIFDRLRFAQSRLKAFVATGKTDFRSPEHFNLWMKGSADFPALGAFLQRRFDKRQPNANPETLSALVQWIDDHDGKVRDELLELFKDDATTVVFAIPYALKRAGKTVAGATPDEMAAALTKYKAGLMRR